MRDIHDEVEAAISVLDTGGVARPHLKPDGHAFTNTVKYKLSQGS